MHEPFFPSPVFGWLTYAVLMVILIVAAWQDLRHMKIPKYLTLPCLGLGIVMNMTRCGWLAGNDLPGWKLGSNGIWLGLLDGFLFALAGFAVGFVVFFMMWLFNTCAA